jgi:hypothetical protein
MSTNSVPNLTSIIVPCWLCGRPHNQIYVANFVMWRLVTVVLEFPMFGAACAT